MANTLGPGSGRPGITREVADFSVAGVATRISSASPTDADWGDTPPPIGTFVVESTGSDSGALIWVKLAVSGGWQVFAAAPQ